MKVTVLADNNAKRGYYREYGLSLFVEHEGLKLLFDAGESDAYLSNAAKSGVSLSETQGIVVSHGHYDHAGGLTRFPQPLPPVYIRPGAFAPRFFKTAAGQLEDVGIPWTFDTHPVLLEAVVWTPERYDLGGGAHTLGDIPCATAFESVSEGFFVKTGEILEPDAFVDEQMLVIETKRGAAVFSGCSHKGIVNALMHAQRSLGMPLFAVFAGMHMEEASGARILHTIRAFRELDVGLVVPLHCTGADTAAAMRRALGGRCALAGAGDVFEL